MEYLSVKNWDHLQQYKDRDPKWIKFYRDVLDDYELEQLPELSQLHLFKIWLLAAKHNNRIPNDPNWIAKKIGAQSKVDIDQLVTNGFLRLYRDVQDCTETYLEEEVETEKEKENTSKPAVSPCPHISIIDIYHETLPELPRVLPSRWAGSASENQLKARWRENEAHRDLDWWRGYFQSVRASDWWMGRESKWKADLHWLVKRSNFDKVVQAWANAA